MKFFRVNDANNNMEIVKKECIKVVKLRKKVCEIIIKDALYSKNDEGKERLLDEVIVNSMIDGIAEAIVRNTSKYNSLPAQITISHNVNENEKSNSHTKTSNEIDKKNDGDNNKEDIVKVYMPKYSFENVCISKDLKREILTTLNIIKNKEILYNDWGLGDGCLSNRAVVLNFYGKPGTGKSMCAQAIAHDLNKKVCLVNYSELESKFVGDTPKNIQKVFEIAKKENAVLVFDEADSFLGKRLSSVTQSADYGVNITRSVLLLELEKFDGVVIFTTNLLSNYDDAFKRRILANIMFDMPDEETRCKIWRVHLGKKVPLEDNVTCEKLGQIYKDITGADIKDIIFYAATNALEKNKTSIGLIEFDYAYKLIKQRYENKMEKDFNNQYKIKEEIITKEQYDNEMSTLRTSKEN